MTFGALAAVMVIAAAPDAELPRQTRVFYNARLALKDKHPFEVLTLWLLRNGLRDSGHPGTHDDAFRSVVWAALGGSGLCPDGFPKDHEGAGLWPLALHNLVLNTTQPEELPSPFDAFDVGRQQRLVTLSDVLSDEELLAVSFSQTGCVALFDQGLAAQEDLGDRLQSGLLLKLLLKKALTTLRRDQVASTALIEARLFDLELALIELRTRKQREAGVEAAATVRTAGMSSGAASQAAADASAWREQPAQLEFLARALSWHPTEWLTLSSARRQYLFSQARAHATDQPAAQAATLALIDALAAQENGAEIAALIGTLGPGPNPADRDVITEGARGQRLLALTDASGFTERAVISLHRGVRALERGELTDALRSFAFSLNTSDASRDASTVHALARRWLSYVLARYQTNDEVLATLKALVPRQDYNPIIEELVWAAALRADQRSFDRLVANARKGGSFDRLLERLALLASGAPGALVTLLRDGAAEGPTELLRFVKRLVDTLEREEGAVRVNNRDFMRQLLALVVEVGGQPGAAKLAERQAQELAGRLQALLEAMGAAAGPGADPRALDLSYSAFAGSLRLAPADPLPWPFVEPEVEAPSAFTPLVLVPMEWRDDGGGLVFGWKITE